MQTSSSAPLHAYKITIDNTTINFEQRDSRSLRSFCKHTELEFRNISGVDLPGLSLYLLDNIEQYCDVRNFENQLSYIKLSSLFPFFLL